MIGEHWCWWLLAMACVVWYSTITIYVAVKGASDIKQMLERLASTEEQAQPPLPEEDAT
jgi:hypothetical protein